MGSVHVGLHREIAPDAPGLQSAQQELDELANIHVVESVHTASR